MPSSTLKNSTNDKDGKKEEIEDGKEEEGEEMMKEEESIKWSEGSLHPIVKINALYETKELVKDKKKLKERNYKFYTEKYISFYRKLYEVKFKENTNRRSIRRTKKKTPFEELSTEFSKRLVEEYKSSRKNSKTFKTGSLEERKLEKERKIELAKNYYKEERFSEAVDLLKAYSNEQNAEILNIYGESLWRKGDFELAVEILTKCIELDPLISSAYFVRGDCYVHMNEFEMGKVEFEKYLKLEYPTKPVLVNLGKCLSTLQNYKGAFECFNRVINEVDSQDPYVYFLRGDILSVMQRYDEASVDFKKVLELDPSFCVEYEESAEQYERNDDLEQALSIFESLIKINPNKAIYYNKMGHLLYAMERNEEAIIVFSKSIDLKPVDERPLIADSYLSKSLIFMESNHLEQALMTLNTGLQELPDDAPMYKSRGTCLLLLNKVKEAKDDFEMLIQLDTSQQVVDGPVFKFMAEYFYHYEKNYIQALHYFNKCFSINYLQAFLVEAPNQLDRPKIGEYESYLFEETKVQLLHCLLLGYLEQKKEEEETSDSLLSPKDKKKTTKKKGEKVILPLFEMCLNLIMPAYTLFETKEIPTIHSLEMTNLLNTYKEFKEPEKGELKKISRASTKRSDSGLKK
ncbi:hypothetical protein ABK040_010081 [Willaertia magna]